LVSVIVVSYNTAAMTLECLRSLHAETSTPFELLVVDNASVDGSAEAIRNDFPTARLFAEPQNHGFAKANNLAAAHATGEFLLLLNPDTVVLEHAIDELVAFARRTPSAGIWGGRTVFGDGSLNPASCWRRMGIWTNLCRVTGLDRAFPASGLLNAEAYGGWQRDTEREVDIVSGCFFLIERRLWLELDGFDPLFNMYGEEADLCLRARSLGNRPRITPLATVVHYGGASESVRSHKHAKLLKAKMSLARRHLPAWRALPAIQLLRLWPLSRWLAASAAARLRPTEKREVLRNDWGDVWSHRQDWWNGYPDPPTRAAPT
jgi:GT2 family glycosyltransferase